MTIFTPSSVVTAPQPSQLAEYDREIQEMEIKLVQARLARKRTLDDLVAQEAEAVKKAARLAVTQELNNRLFRLIEEELIVPIPTKYEGPMVTTENPTNAVVIEYLNNRIRDIVYGIPSRQGPKKTGVNDLLAMEKFEYTKEIQQEVLRYLSTVIVTIAPNGKTHCMRAKHTIPPIGTVCWCHGIWCSAHDKAGIPMKLRLTSQISKMLAAVVLKNHGVEPPANLSIPVLKNLHLEGTQSYKGPLVYNPPSVSGPLTEFIRTKIDRILNGTGPLVGAPCVGIYEKVGETSPRVQDLALGYLSKIRVRVFRGGNYVVFQVASYEHVAPALTETACWCKGYWCGVHEPKIHSTQSVATVMARIIRKDLEEFTTSSVENASSEQIPV